MGNWVTDIFKKKKEEEPLPSWKKYASAVSVQAPLNCNFTATQIQMQNSNYNMQMAHQQQQQQEHALAIRLRQQEQQMMQMVQGMPALKFDVPPENAAIRDCHCVDGCWDCNGSKVMAIPTIEWTLNS
jgi:predicted neuraminidase